MTVSICMNVDEAVLSAEVPLGATLGDFLRAAGCESIEGPLTDGARLLSLDLELAFRHRGAELSSHLPAELTREIPALVADELLVLAENQA